jgi:heat shock protein HslJ
MLRTTAVAGSIICAAMLMVSCMTQKPPAFAGNAPGGEHMGITGPVWQWVQTLYNDDRTVVPTDPENYTVQFQKDGTISVKADCNQKGGTVSIPPGENRISIEITHSTMAFCPKGSLEDEFVKGLSAAAIYFIKNGDLYIDLKYDSGTMQFLKQEG